MIDAYAALRHPFVRLFAIGRFASIAGWQMINVAVGWQLYERTGNAWSLGLVGVVELAPVLLLMVIAGNAADRYPRRNVAIFAHGWLRAAPGAGALTMALMTTRLPPWERPGRTLLLVVAGFGLATVGFGLSRSFVLSLACLFLTGVFDNVSVVIRLTLEHMMPRRCVKRHVERVSAAAE